MTVNEVEEINNVVAAQLKIAARTDISESLLR